MIFTAPIAANGSPEEQTSSGHGLTFDNTGNYTLAASNTSPPVGMDGFRTGSQNDACPYAFMLNLRFSAAPTNWRVEMGVNNFFNRATTWDDAEVGNLALDTFIAQPSNAAAAVKNDTIRLLVPQIAGNISSVRITLGSTERTQLISANFHRVIAVLHPTPAFQGRPQLSPKIRSREGLDGRTHSLFRDDPLFRARLVIEAWDNERDLLDLDVLPDVSKFAIWPSGLESTFTPGQAVKYRRPQFARNCIISRSRGIAGVDGLDIPDGPAGVDFEMRESF